MAKQKPYIWIIIVSVLAAILIGVFACAIKYYLRFVEFNKIKQDMTTFDTEMVVLKEHS